MSKDIEDTAKNDSSASGAAGDAAAAGADSQGNAARPADARALRRATRAAEKARKAQERADRARAEALAAVRASGFTVTDDDAPASDSATAASASGAREAAASGGAAGRAAAAKADAAKKSDATDDTDASAGSGEGDNDSADRDSRSGAEAEAIGRSGNRIKTPSLSGRPGLAVHGNPAFALGLLVATVVLALVGALAFVGLSHAKADAAADQAETDAPAAAAEAARQTVTQMFTYDYQNVDAKMSAVEPMLVGQAEKEFREDSRPKVTSAAKTTQANSYATVAAVGIEKVNSPDAVSTVVMLNRMVSTKDQPEAQSSATRLRVQMQRVDDGREKVWKVAKVEVL